MDLTSLCHYNLYKPKKGVSKGVPGPLGRRQSYCNKRRKGRRFRIPGCQSIRWGRKKQNWQTLPLKTVLDVDNCILVAPKNIRPPSIVVSTKNNNVIFHHLFTYPYSETVISVTMRFLKTVPPSTGLLRDREIVVDSEKYQLNADIDG